MYSQWTWQSSTGSQLPRLLFWRSGEEMVWEDTDRMRFKWGQRGSRHDTNEMCVYQTKWRQTGLKMCLFDALGFCFSIHIWRKWFKSKGFLLFLSFFFLGMLYFMQVKKNYREQTKEVLFDISKFDRIIIPLQWNFCLCDCMCAL